MLMLLWVCIDQVLGRETLCALTNKVFDMHYNEARRERVQQPKVAKCALSNKTVKLSVKRGGMSKEQKDDRPSKHSPQMIGDALVELMLEKSFDAITAQDILDRANVGRSTFYAHYTDKEDLLSDQITRVIQDLDTYTAHAERAHGGILPSLALFRHVQECLCRSERVL
jgi:hypothetical protein